MYLKIHKCACHKSLYWFVKPIYDGVINGFDGLDLFVNQSTIHLNGKVQTEELKYLKTHLCVCQNLVSHYFCEFNLTATLVDFDKMIANFNYFLWNMTGICLMVK